MPNTTSLTGDLQHREQGGRGGGKNMEAQQHYERNTEGANSTDAKHNLFHR
jgi:hypothetical protein